MIERSNIHLTSSLKSFSRAASVTVFLVGCLVLIGWWLDIPTLKSIFPGLVTMKANTALCFILSGVSLWLLQTTEQTEKRRRRIAQGCAFAVSLVGLLTLSQYLFGWNLGIDQLLFREPSGAIGTSNPGRMAPTTAINFVLVGFALLFLDVETDRGYRPAQFVILPVAFISFLAFAGY